MFIENFWLPQSSFKVIEYSRIIGRIKQKPKNALEIDWVGFFFFSSFPTPKAENYSIKIFFYC